MHPHGAHVQRAKRNQVRLTTRARTVHPHGAYVTCGEPNEIELTPRCGGIERNAAPRCPRPAVRHQEVPQDGRRRQPGGPGLLVDVLRTRRHTRMDAAHRGRRSEAGQCCQHHEGYNTSCGQFVVIPPSHLHVHPMGRRADGTTKSVFPPTTTLKLNGLQQAPEYAFAGSKKGVTHCLDCNSVKQNVGGAPYDFSHFHTPRWWLQPAGKCSRYDLLLDIVLRGSPRPWVSQVAHDLLLASAAGATARSTTRPWR